VTHLHSFPWRTAILFGRYHVCGWEGSNHISNCRHLIALLHQSCPKPLLHQSCHHNTGPFFGDLTLSPSSAESRHFSFEMLWRIQLWSTIHVSQAFAQNCMLLQSLDPGMSPKGVRLHIWTFSFWKYSEFGRRPSKIFPACSRSTLFSDHHYQCNCPL
jgi:hypothetical protein